jgi:hypothetical protein
MSAFRDRYGAHPAHLLAVLAGTALAVVALGPLLEERRGDVLGWFVGSALVHDALLLPLYVGLDAVLVALWRRRPGRVAWINFARLPLAISGILFLVWSPLITRQAEQYAGATGRSTDPYLGRWLAVSAALAAASFACWLLRRVVVARTDRIGTPA